jgi:ABC-type transport system involved in multi-copper enzyme maturation permease subunit
MVGPVFYQDMLLAARRGRQHIFRWIYGGWLVAQVLFFLFMVAVDFWRPRNSYIVALVASRFLAVYVVQQMILMALAVPAFAASAITDEKTRGTLQYLLTTELEGRHLILGKLLARSAQVFVLFLTGLPLFCFLGAIGGLDPTTLLALISVTVVPLIALGAATLLASVWCMRTRDAVLGLYAVGLIGFLAVHFLGGPLRYFDPLFVLDPFRGDSDELEGPGLGARLLGSVIAWGTLGAVCLILAVWRLRPAYRRQLEGEGAKQSPRWWRAERVPLGDDLIQWREQHVEGLAPVPWLRFIPRWLGIAVVFGLTTLSSWLILTTHLAPRTSWDDVLGSILRVDLAGLSASFDPEVGIAFRFQALVAMLLASLIVGIRCSGAIVGERERASWEALLLTPLTAKQLVRGKLWAVMGASYIYLAAYAVPAIACSALTCGSGLFWTVLWLAVTLLAMYFLGASGLYCSVRAKTSWRSLLSTMGIGYVGGFLIYLCATPVIGLLALIVLILLALIQYLLKELVQVSLMPTTAQGMVEFVTAFFIASCIGLALIFWLMSRFFLSSAQKWVAQRERVRYWDEEPLRYTPRRRRRSAVHG